MAGPATDAEHPVGGVESRSAHFKIGFRLQLRRSRAISPAHTRVRSQIHIRRKSSVLDAKFLQFCSWLFQELRVQKAH
jgi:hypothetical protein